MSREHKYRVWDKVEERMDYNVGLVGNRILFEYGDIDPNESYVDANSYVDIDENNEKYFELMQYIGIKDKNKTNIYESDIVKVTWANGTKSINYIVKYAEDCAYYMLECVTDEFELDTFCGYDTSQLEVVGNIYQNTEFLVGGKLDE